MINGLTKTIYVSLIGLTSLTFGCAKKQESHVFPQEAYNMYFRDRSLFAEDKLKDIIKIPSPSESDRLDLEQSISNKMFESSTYYSSLFRKEKRFEEMQVVTNSVNLFNNYSNQGKNLINNTTYPLFKAETIKLNGKDFVRIRGRSPVINSLISSVDNHLGISISDRNTPYFDIGGSWMSAGIKF